MGRVLQSSESRSGPTSLARRREATLLHVAPGERPAPLPDDSYGLARAVVVGSALGAVCWLALGYAAWHLAELLL